MDIILFFLLILIVFLILILGLIFISFWLPKKLGYPKAGKIIGTLVCCFFAYQIITWIFEDEFFSKNDAIELLNEEKIPLEDDFKIEKNEFSSLGGSHTFELSISQKDRNQILRKIKSAENFLDSSTHSTSILNKDLDRYNGSKVYQNFETNTEFIRESFEPNGQGYAPRYRKITINKTTSELTFEDFYL